MAAAVSSASRPELGSHPVPSPPATPKASPAGSARKAGKGNSKEIVEHGGSPLPDLRTSDMAVDRTKPLPTSLQSDFIPEDLLFALTQPPPLKAKDNLLPPSRTKTQAVVPAGREAWKEPTPPRRPDNVWNFSRRSRYKHLTDNTICTCGAGKDISFLYDAVTAASEDKEPTPPTRDKYDRSSIRADAVKEVDKNIALPDSLIPDEYHIVKSKGVMGLEYHDDKFTTDKDDHEKHLTMFPSLRPSGRYEVVHLQKVMDDMLTKVGVEDDELEVKGPTQMHNLLELIRKEQKIYNIIFHELIRQVSVECSERGELLSNLRQRYATLLDKVPRQVKSLHAEVMAQRALDRRLTEELMRFKGSITSLTSELADVREHDRQVTREAQQAQEDLAVALTESEKNASLLSEYHDLYELQRRRLETHVIQLSEERELWSTAAYNLALKVIELNSLSTARRLYISEKAWCKLTSHFTILLGDKDTEELAIIQHHVETWRDLVTKFNLQLSAGDKNLRQKFNNMKEKLTAWSSEIGKFVGETATTSATSYGKLPGPEMVKQLYDDISIWEDVISTEMETFAGDHLLGFQDQLAAMNKHMESWTDASLKVFNRHHTEDGSNYPDHEKMIKLNEEVETLVKQYNIRVMGENGVAKEMIMLQNGYETWHNKLGNVGKGASLSDNDWYRLYEQFDTWITQVGNIVLLVGTTQREEDREAGKPHTSVTIEAVVKNVHMWLSSTMNGINSEDSKLAEQCDAIIFGYHDNSDCGTQTEPGGQKVAKLHTSMVHWMVQLLLKLAPDHTPKVTASLQGVSTAKELQETARELFDKLAKFSKYIVQCCQGIVMDLMQEKVDAGEEDADHEFRELKRVKSESQEWIRTAKLLLNELLGEESEFKFENLELPKEEGPGGSVPPSRDGRSLPPTREGHGLSLPPTREGESRLTPGETPSTAVPGTPADGERKEEETKSGDGQQSGEEKKPEEDTTQMQVIGHDDNVHPQSLEDKPKEAVGEGIAVSRPDTPQTKKAYEALAAVDALQKQLLDTEERAQTSEEKVSTLEEELRKAKERIRDLERRTGTPGPTPDGEGAEPETPRSTDDPDDRPTTPSRKEKHKKKPHKKK
ncbi:axonemal dynein light chain domain-containing protein 1-like isoform X2 [Branchiostoma floridae x Branchiostoma japonicum]